MELQLMDDSPAVLDEESEPRNFAVVRWSEGRDKGTISDVKTECIRGYDDSKMDRDGDPITEYSAYIEWRHGKKPKAGWPYYKGTIIFVAGTRFETSRKLKAMLNRDEPAEEELTKRVSVVPQKYRDDSSGSASNDETQILEVKKSKPPPKKDAAEQFLAMYGSSRYSSAATKSPQNTPQKRDRQLKREIQNLKEENAALKKQVLQEVPELLRRMKQFIDVTQQCAAPNVHEKEAARMRPTTLQHPPGSPQSSLSPYSTPPRPRSTEATSLNPSRTSEAMSSKGDRMEIPGTGIYIDKLAWAYAQNASTATVYVRHLLTAVFPADVLLVSNLRGGNRGGGSTRLPLDKQKVDAIYRATLQKWPMTPTSQIGSAINAKITEMRSKNKKPAPNDPST